MGGKTSLSADGQTPTLCCCGDCYTGKKGYLQMVTTMGNLNLEIYCDMAPQTSENFLKLCQKGYYDGTKFHRLVKDFMVQVSGVIWQSGRVGWMRCEAACDV